MDESALQETTEVSTKEYDDDDDDDILEMKDVIVKEEKPDISELKKEEKSDVHNGDNNNEDEDDDVIVMPTQEPIITEVLDDTDVAIDVQPEPIDNRLNMTDDDVMINEPKIETQNLVDDEDSDNSDDEDFVSKKTNESPDVTLLPIIVKIKEEPKDDGYEDEQNEEDNFVEVTTIANDDFIHGM